MEYDSFRPQEICAGIWNGQKVVGWKPMKVELEEKAEILQEPLDNHNDGRRKTFYSWQYTCWNCRIQGNAMEQIVRETSGEECRKRRKETVQGDDTLKEKAAAAVGCFFGNCTKEKGN